MSVVAKRLDGLSRPWSRRHCVRLDPVPPQKGAQQPPFFCQCLLWPNGHPSQHLMQCGIKLTFNFVRMQRKYGYYSSFFNALLSLIMDCLTWLQLQNYERTIQGAAVGKLVDFHWAKLVHFLLRPMRSAIPDVKIGTWTHQICCTRNIASLRMDRDRSCLFNRIVISTERHHVSWFGALPE